MFPFKIEKDITWHKRHKENKGSEREMQARSHRMRLKNEYKEEKQTKIELLCRLRSLQGPICAEQTAFIAHLL